MYKLKYSIGTQNLENSGIICAKSSLVNDYTLIVAVLNSNYVINGPVGSGDLDAICDMDAVDETEVEEFLQQLFPGVGLAVGSVNDATDPNPEDDQIPFDAEKKYTINHVVYMATLMQTAGFEGLFLKTCHIEEKHIKLKEFMVASGPFKDGENVDINYPIFPQVSIKAADNSKGISMLDFECDLSAFMEPPGHYAGDFWLYYGIE